MDYAKKLIYTFGAVLLPSIAQAQLSIELEAGVARSDNLLRDESGERDETIGVAGIGLGYEHNSARLQASANGNAEFRHYVDGVASDETLANFNGSAEYQIVPGVFSWQVTDQFGRALRDIFSPDSPTNRENVNRFTTGPVFTTRLGDVTSLEASAQYSLLTFEDSDTDADEISGGVSVIRQLSRNRSAGFSVEFSSAELGDMNTVDYDRRAIYLTFNSRTGRSNLSVDLGVNEVDTGNDTNDGLLADISLSRDLTQRSSVSVSYRQEIASSTNLFDQLQSGGRIPTETSNFVGTNNPVDTESLSVSFNFVQSRTRFYVDGTLAKENVEGDDTLDRDRLSLSAGVSRQLGSGWSGDLSASIQQYEFDLDGRENDDSVFRLGVSKDLSRDLSINAQIQRLNRDSNVSLQDSTENTIQVTLRYRL